MFTLDPRRASHYGPRELTFTPLRAEPSAGTLGVALRGGSGTGIDFKIVFNQAMPQSGHASLNQAMP